MSRPIAPLALLLAAALIQAPLAHGQGWSAPAKPAPPPAPPADCDTAGAFAQGSAAGQAEGYALGASHQRFNCLTDPASCDIYLSACLPEAFFGETEPNDNIVTANPLVLDSKFWGQSLSAQDQDWFYVTSWAPNQNLVINFSVPNGLPGGWNVSVRNAAGSVYAQFDTGSVPAATSPDGDITFPVTLGLVGTYYIVVRPTQLRQEPYNIAAMIQDSLLLTENFVVGFFDAEVEPNNDPNQWNPLVAGVTMYGTINLNFAPGTEIPVAEGEGFVYSQSEDEDWFLYPSMGNEIVTVAVCDRDPCDAGNWLFEVFDQPGAAARAAGDLTYPPILAFNSDTASPDQFVFGVVEPGNFWVRVDHKRLLTAQCSTYALDLNNDREPDPNEPCVCEAGAAECTSPVVLNGVADGLIAVKNQVITDDEPPLTVDTVTYFCPDGSPGTVLNPPGNPPYATRDSGLGDTVRCDVPCLCRTYRGTITLPGDALTSQYNFTLHSTQIPPSTGDSDAYRAYLSRPNPLTQ
jgi:hypothetical protein